MQNCPAKVVRAFSILGAAASRSASANTIIGVLPPSSVWNSLSVGAPAAEIAFPVFVLPVKLITRMSGDSMRKADPPLPTLSLNTLTTPFGRSAASARTWLKRKFVCAVLPGSLITVVTPAARAGARNVR